jgi:hypothetical protein
LAAKLNMVSIMRVESPELRAEIGMLGRFPFPENEATDDSDAPNSLMNASGTPALRADAKTTTH